MLWWWFGWPRWTHKKCIISKPLVMKTNRVAYLPLTWIKRFTAGVSEPDKHNNFVVEKHQLGRMFVQAILPDNSRSHVVDCSQVNTATEQNLLCAYSRVWYVCVPVPEYPERTFQGIEPCNWILTDKWYSGSLNEEQVFWNVMPMRLVNTYRRLEDTKIFRNDGKYLVTYSGNIPETTRPWESKISH